MDTYLVLFTNSISNLISKFSLGFSLTGTSITGSLGLTSSYNLLTLGFVPAGSGLKPSPLAIQVREAMVVRGVQW